MPFPITNQPRSFFVTAAEAIATLTPGLSAISLPACFVGADQRYAFANHGYLRLIDRTRDAVVGKKVSDILSPAEYAQVRPHLEAAFTSGRDTHFHRLIVDVQGNEKWVLVNYIPQRLASGEIYGLIAVVTNAERLKKLERETLERERLMRSITDRAGLPIVHLDASLKFLFANQPFFDWIGRNKSEVLGRTIDAVFPSETVDFYAPLARRALAGETFKIETTSTVRVGAQRRLEVSFFPDADENGVVSAAIFMVRDIEDDHRLRDELLARERRIRLITDNVGLPISYIDADMRVQFYNRAGLEWINLREIDVIGKPMHEVFGAEAVSEVAPWLSSAFNGEPQTYERLAKKRDGESRWVRGHMVPDIDDSGKVVGVFTVLTDIDSDVRMRRDLEEQGRQLRLFTDNIPESIAYLSRERKYKFVNNTFLQQRGIAREDAIGKTYVEVIGTEAAAAAAPILDRAFAGETVVYERLVKIAGANRGESGRWFRIRAVPDFGADGVVQGIYLVGIDIHEIKTAQDMLRTNEAELRQAMDSLPYPMAYVDKSLTYQFVNRTMESLMGKTRDALVGSSMQKLFNSSRLKEIEPIWQRVLKGETITMERLITAGDDKQRWMNVRYTPRRNALGEVIGFYSASTDIDELKRAEIELRRANWMLSSHFENTPLAVIEWDAAFRVRRWSPQAERIFGWTEQEVLGKRLKDLKFVVEDDRAEVMGLVERLQNQSEMHVTSLNRNYRKDGRIIWCEWYNSNLADDTGKLVSVLSLAQDVTARVEAEERLVHQATHDSLTGLPNRSLLQDRLRQAITRGRRNQSRVATLFIDLDRFKDVNDTLGHRVGDELLRAMASRLNAAVRESDILVRLSGDEFMVVLEQIGDLDAATRVAAKLLDEIRAPSFIEGNEIFVSGSIGISVFPDDADDADTLLRHADMAMYHAKQTGKNTFRVFSADLAEHGSNMRMLENALRASIARSELELYYQPKVDMVTNRIVGAEALLRWHHPQRGLIMPGEFIHLAEETGLVHRIGDWVLEAAIAQVRKWRASGHRDMHLAINLSAGQFHASNLSDRIIECVRREGCDPGMIELEITETGMLQNPEGVGRTISALREFGLSVAIDDFGTGYSSLSHLKRFPIDTLKIDRSFVSDVLTDRDDAAIVAAVIALAKALEIRVVAEGVETEQQRAHLAALGCHAYQGYLVSPALPITDFEALLKAQNLGS